MISAVLGLTYTVSEQEIIFEDGVKYTIQEAQLLKGLSATMLITIHEIKKRFGGKVRLSV